MYDAQNGSGLPLTPGVGYKSAHFEALMADPGPIGWIEIHAENYMGAGGRPIAQLKALAGKFAISVHGVGLSIGSEGPLDQDHLSRLRHLLDWLQPASFSEHLAWSSHDVGYLNDLLPLPYNEQTLLRVCAHIDEVQDKVGRRMLLENPSNYLEFDQSTIPEVEFLAEIATRTGCGLLFDVNNVFVSATNQGTDPLSYINAFPLGHVGELHLGGHSEDVDDQGRPFLIDSHGAPVVEPVWALYDHTIARGGPKPSLIEWDTDVPEFSVLRAEAERASQTLQAAVETAAQ